MLAATNCRIQLLIQIYEYRTDDLRRKHQIWLWGIEFHTGCKNNSELQEQDLEDIETSIGEQQGMVGV